MLILISSFLSATEPSSDHTTPLGLTPLTGLGFGLKTVV